jgi:DNA polymerase eta
MIQKVIFVLFSLHGLTDFIGYIKDREKNLQAWLNPIKVSSKSHDVNLAIGALIVEDIRKDIYDKLGFKCSAGIATNKTLAKFCCGINKPNRQTILPLQSINDLMNSTPVQKMYTFIINLIW